VIDTTIPPTALEWETSKLEAVGMFLGRGAVLLSTEAPAAQKLVNSSVRTSTRAGRFISGSYAFLMGGSIVVSKKDASGPSSTIIIRIWR
jgi:hypothetical protein